MVYGDSGGNIPVISAIIQSGNLYVYSGNNPVMFIDASGKLWTYAGNNRFFDDTTGESFSYNISNPESFANELNQLSIDIRQQYEEEMFGEGTFLRAVWDYPLPGPEAAVVAGKGIVVGVGAGIRNAAEPVGRGFSYGSKLLRGATKAITAPTNRGGLRDALLKQGTKPFADAQVHHGLPWEFREWFASKGLNVNDSKYGAWVKGGGNGGHQSWSNAYSAEWQKFINNPSNRNATPAQIEDFYNSLRQDVRWGGGF